MQQCIHNLGVVVFHIDLFHSFKITITNTLVLYLYTPQKLVVDLYQCIYVRER